MRKSKQFKTFLKQIENYYDRVKKEIKPAYQNRSLLSLAKMIINSKKRGLYVLKRNCGNTPQIPELIQCKRVEEIGGIIALLEAKYINNKFAAIAKKALKKESTILKEELINVKTAEQAYCVIDQLLTLNSHNKEYCEQLKALDPSCPVVALLKEELKKYEAPEDPERNEEDLQEDPKTDTPKKTKSTIKAEIIQKDKPKGLYLETGEIITSELQKGRITQAVVFYKSKTKEMTSEQIHAIQSHVRKVIKKDDSIEDEIKKQFKQETKNPEVTKYIKEKQAAKTEENQKAENRLSISFEDCLKVIEIARIKAEVKDKNQWKYLAILLALLCGFRVSDLVKGKLKRKGKELYIADLGKKRHSGFYKLMFSESLTSADEIEQKFKLFKKLIKDKVGDGYCSIEFNRKCHPELCRKTSQLLAPYLKKGLEGQLVVEYVKYGKDQVEHRGASLKDVRDMSGALNYVLHKLLQMELNGICDVDSSFIKIFLRHDSLDTSENYKRVYISDEPITAKRYLKVKTEVREKDKDIKKVLDELMSPSIKLKEIANEVRTFVDTVKGSLEKEQKKKQNMNNVIDKAENLAAIKKYEKALKRTEIFIKISKWINKQKDQMVDLTKLPQDIATPMQKTRFKKFRMKDYI